MLRTALLQRQQGRIGIDYPSSQNILKTPTSILQQNKMHRAINRAHLIRHLSMLSAI